VVSYDDGNTFDLESDVLVLEAKTPWGMPSGGGFGNTVQLEDGMLATAYSYRDGEEKTHVEVMRWWLPEMKS